MEKANGRHRSFPLEEDFLVKSRATENNSLGNHSQKADLGPNQDTFPASGIFLEYSLNTCALLNFGVFMDL